MAVDSMNPLEVDFKDLEAKYSVDDAWSLDNFVLVDGLPVVPAAKTEKLVKVLAKQFAKAAPLRANDADAAEAGFTMPLNAETQMSQGFAFVEFETPEGAEAAIKAFNNKKLDAKHTLLVDRMATVAKYVDGVDSEYKPPSVPEFRPLPHLRAWLADPLGRDQAVMHSASGVGVFWFRKNAEPRAALEPSLSFSDSFVRWSPKGTYLLSAHPQGVALHAGPKFEIVARFPHRDVRLVDFSPDERFLVTGSKTPIKAGGVFTSADEGHNIAMWAIETQAAVRSFPLPPQTNPGAPPKWPAFQWSGDSRYFARIAKPGVLSIYDSETASLVGKKSMQVSGIASFSFAPAAATPNTPPYLVFWTPEAANQTAKVCVVNAATKEVVHNRSLFNVVQVRFFWQNEGKFLCSKIDRLTKNKKAITSSLEIYRVGEKSMPIEVLDFKETVMDFAWEPRSDRFAIVSYFEALPAPSTDGSAGGPGGPGGPGGLGGGAMPGSASITGGSGAVPINPQRNVLRFFALEREKKLEGTWKEANHMKDSGVVGLQWSPNGRFLATKLSGSGKLALNIFDVSHEVPVPAAANGALPAAAELPINVILLRTVEHLGAQSLAWDPSGRYLLTLATAVEGSAGGRGFQLWDIAGNLLRKQQVDGLVALMWRPRPRSQLTKEQRRAVGKSLKAKADEYDLQDASLALEDSQDAKRRHEQLVASWAAFRVRAREVLAARGLRAEEDRLEVKDGVVYVERVTVVEEEEEEVE